MWHQAGLKTSKPGTRIAWQRGKYNQSELFERGSANYTHTHGKTYGISLNLANTVEITSEDLTAAGRHQTSPTTALTS